MNPHHLPRLQSLQHENPTKRISLIRLAWSDIEKALARGHTLKLVHCRLLEDGLHISYSLLSLYVRRLQGKESVKKQPQQFQATKASLPVQAVDRQRESLRTDKEKESAPPNSARKTPLERVEEPALVEPWELNAIAEQEAKDGKNRCFFKERIPDIDELFRVTKPTQGER
jgi:hypothetical protein